MLIHPEFENDPWYIKTPLILLVLLLVGLIGTVVAIVAIPLLLISGVLVIIGGTALVIKWIFVFIARVINQTIYTAFKC